jgi:phosphoglycolate phosphatase
MRVLHFAPEEGLAKYLRDVVGAENYHARDIDVRRYQTIGVKQFDLIREAAALPDAHYDLIIHNHVMEHLPCNVTAILYHLHRALKPGGRHVFSVPILPGRYDETFSDIPEPERVKRFGQFDHVRRFGRDDIHQSLGMLFRIPQDYDISRTFSVADLEAANIPAEAWNGFTSHTVFCLKKDDLLLAPRETAQRKESVDLRRALRNLVVALRPRWSSVAE